MTNSIYRFIKAIAQHVQDRQGNTEVAGRFQTKDIDIKKRLKLPATKNCDYLERKWLIYLPLFFFVKTLFLVSLKIGRVENEAILHTYIKNTYSTKTTYKNKEMYFIYELSPLYQKSLKAQLITHYMSHWLNEVNHGQTMRFRVAFVLWVISKNVEVPRYIS